MSAPASALPFFRAVGDKTPQTSADAVEPRAAAGAPSVTHDVDAVTESLRTLRTHLLLRARGETRTFVLASARPKEGKSTIAVGLAATFAAAGRRTLLVDGDLRRPSVHRLLGLPNHPGFAEVLSDSLPLAAGTHQVSTALSVMTSGRCASDPQELFLSARLETSIAAMKAAFEIVLFDSAPVLAATDTPLLAARTDGVIVVVRGGLPTTADIRLLRARLTAAGASIVGSVLNQFDGPPAQAYHPYSYAPSE